MTLKELQALRGQMKTELEHRATDGKTTQIIVGMGTCGIASGAKETLNEFVKLIDEKGLTGSVMIRQTGCMGLCAHEPTVEIVSPKMPRVIYGDVTAKVVKDIVEQHLIGHKLLDKLIIDKPADDILKK